MSDVATNMLADMNNTLAKIDSVSLDDWLAASSLLVHAVDEALVCNRHSALRELETQVQSLFRTMYSGSPEIVRKGVRGALPASDGACIAYKLGEVSFAQALLTHARGKAVQEEVVQIAGREPMARYVQLLYLAELTNTELCRRWATQGGAARSAEQVSRDLAKLRAHGITGVRRIGRESFNYLTAIGRDIYETHNPAAAILSPWRPPISARAQAVKQVSEPRFQGYIRLSVGK